MAEEERNRREYGFNRIDPEQEHIERHREEKALDVVLTDEEFAVVKKAVVEVM